VCAGGEAQKGALALGSITSGIATIRRRTNRLHVWQKSNADE
jgi:hypothetical protein